MLWRLPPAKSGVEGFAGGPDSARLAHNGMVIRPVVDYRDMAYQWSSRWCERNLLHPSVAVFDTRHLLGVTLNRYELTDRSLPFEEALLGSIGEDVVARALAIGPSSHPLAKRWGLRPVHTRHGWLPLTPGLVAARVKHDLCVLWTSEFSSPESATRFVDGSEEEGSWKSLPYRLVLPLARRGADDDRRRERDQWGYAQDDIALGIKELASMLGRTAVASIFWRSGGDEPVVHTLKRAVGDESSREERLKELGGGLINLDAPDTIALSVLRRDEGPPDADPLAAAWDSLLGGALDLDRAARKARREELVEADPRLREMIVNWERLDGRLPRNV